MHNYTCPESCISQIWPYPSKNCPAVFAPSGLLDELLNNFHTPVLDVLWYSYPGIPAAAVFIL